MKKVSVIVFLLFFASLASGQGAMVNNDVGLSTSADQNTNTTSSLNLFLAENPLLSSLEKATISDRVENFCEQLASKKNRKGKDFLKYVFYRTHKEFLNKYEINSPLFQTFEKGNYDCVSGTALFALILQNLDIPFEIKETKFHVYIVSSFNNSYQLLESTDPFDGFLDDEEKILAREKEYFNQSQSGDNLYVFQGEIFKSITVEQLAGLEFYNQGIVHFNDKNILKSLSRFERALELYNCPRIQEIFKMSLESLASEVKYSKSIGLAQRYEYYSSLIGN